MSMGTLMVLESAQSRRRRDERGRYMGDDQPGMEMRGGQYPSERRSEMYSGDRGMISGGYDAEMRRGGRRNAMEGGGNQRESREGRRNEMAGGGETRNEMRGGRRNEMAGESEMRGEGYVQWDNLVEPIYYGQEGGGGRGERAERSNITDMREYGRRYSPQSHMEDGGKNHRQMTQQRQIGFQHHREGEGGGEHLTRHQAEAWVEGMEDGAKWKNPEDVKALAQRLGITGEEKLVEFWALLNATYSDICKVAKRYNVDRSDFYADMTKALFLEDEDAVAGKPVLYYEYLVKKDDD